MWWGGIKFSEIFIQSSGGTLPTPRVNILVSRGRGVLEMNSVVHMVVQFQTPSRTADIEHDVDEQG